MSTDVKADGLLLASASRTATTATDQMDSIWHPFLVIYLDWTVQAAAETLRPDLQARDPVSGNWTNYATTTAVTGVGTYFKAFGPSANNGGATNFEGKNVPFPRQWRINVVHSGSGAQTYSLGYCLCR